MLFSLARSSALFPSLSAISGSASCSKSNWTISWWPSIQAVIKGVLNWMKELPSSSNKLNLFTLIFLTSLFPYQGVAPLSGGCIRQFIMTNYCYNFNKNIDKFVDNILVLDLHPCISFKLFLSINLVDYRVKILFLTISWS